MSVARFIADQRTKYQVPHTLVSASRGWQEVWTRVCHRLERARWAGRTREGS